MHRRVVSLLATGALLASLGVLAAPGAAIAEDPPEPVPVEPMPAEVAVVPVVSPTSGPPGTVISITVPGCTGIVVAAIGLADSEEALAFTEGPGPTVQLTVPAGTPQGEVIVAAGCDVYDEGDVGIAGFTVTAGAVVASPTLTG